MGARASHLREFRRFKKRVRPMHSLPLNHPERQAANEELCDWQDLFYRMGRRPSVMGRRAQRRYARAVARRISSGKMRPKDQQYAACLAKMSHAAIDLAQAFQNLAAVCARIDLRVLFAMQRGLTGDLADLESIPSQAPG